MRYQEFSPSSHLRPYIKCYWQLEGMPKVLTPERVVPDGRMELIFHFGQQFQRLAPHKSLQPRAVLAGQLTSAIDIVPTGSIGIFAVRFRPQGFTAIFEESAILFNDQIVSLEIIHRDFSDDIQEKILLANSGAERVRFVETFLEKVARRSRVLDRVPRAAAQFLIENPSEDRILHLARELGISLRQLERQFKSQVGLSPSRFISVARFQQALRLKLISPTLTFATVAAECGYYDQSHFSREFKALAGATPKEYFGGTNEMADFFSV